MSGSVVAGATAGPMPGFAPYAAGDSGATVGEITAICNREMFHGYGPLRPGEPDRPVAYPLCAYRQLIASLAAMEHIECVTLGDLCRKPLGGDRVRLAIRHDVDGDIVAAELCAQIEAEFGVASSYYFLHTAYYYGLFEPGRFLRHGCMGHVYRRIQSLGHEVGLHTNGLEVYRGTVAAKAGEKESVPELDGAQSVAAEIAWMRSVGLEVRGTVGHGSKAVFGAENFEIFRGRVKGRPRDDTAHQEPALVEHGGRSAWVHVLDEGGLGLEYEGNDIFWSMRSRVEYGATRTVDGWRWNRRFDKGALGSLAFCSQEAMLADIGRLAPGCCAVLTVHPCYYGYRHRPDASPTLRLDRRAVVVNPELGWQTWDPESVVAVAEAHADARLARQSFGVANDLGMLDADPAFSEGGRGAARRVLFLDGAALADAGIDAGSNAARVAETELKRRLEASAPGASGSEESVACLTLAHPGMGAARLYGWLEWAMERFGPTDVVLGVGSRELAWSMPGLWSEMTGLSAIHPAGVCLVPDEGGAPEVRGVSPGWVVRQRRPRARVEWPGTDIPLERAMGARSLPRVDGVQAEGFVGACIARLGERSREGGARFFVALTEDGPAGREGGLMDAYRGRVCAWAEAAGAGLIDAIDAVRRLADEGIAPLRSAGGLSVDGHRVLGLACARILAEASDRA